MSFEKYVNKVAQDEITFLDARLLILTTLINENRRIRDLLSRNIGLELARIESLKDQGLEVKRGCYEELEDIKEALNEAYSDLSGAYDNLESAKNSIASWHNKSKSNFPLYGNGGKKLPNHSFFGQSFGDLEGYKYDRSRAVENIGEAKSLISELKDSRDKVFTRLKSSKDNVGEWFSQIGALKSVQRDVNYLKGLGHSIESLEIVLSQLEAEKKEVLTKRSSVGAEVEQIEEEFLKIGSTRFQYEHEAL